MMVERNVWPAATKIFKIEQEQEQIERSEISGPFNRQNQRLLNKE